MATAAKYLLGEEPDEGMDSECPCMAEASKPAKAPTDAFLKELHEMYPQGAVVEPTEPDDTKKDGSGKMRKLEALMVLLGED